MSIGERVRLLRKELGLNQAQFAEKIGLKQAAIGLYENNQRGVADRIILLICEKYSVREEWLRDGIEPMFVESDSTIVSQLSSEYGLDAFEMVILKGFLKMKPEQREFLKDRIKDMLSDILDDEAAYKEFRAAYDKKHALPFAARGGDASGLAEAAERFNSTLSATDDKDGM